MAVCGKDFKDHKAVSKAFVAACTGLHPSDIHPAKPADPIGDMIVDIKGPYRGPALTGGMGGSNVPPDPATNYPGKGSAGADTATWALRKAGHALGMDKK